VVLSDPSALASAADSGVMAVTEDSKASVADASTTGVTEESKLLAVADSRRLEATDHSSTHCFYTRRRLNEYRR
jgi:hypothetical protein